MPPRSLGRDLGGGNGQILAMSRRLDMVEQHMTQSNKDMEVVKQKLDMLIQAMLPTGTGRTDTVCLAPTSTTNETSVPPSETMNPIGAMKLVSATINESERAQSASGISDVGFHAIPGNQSPGTSSHITSSTVASE